jgi:hypothetical protein
MPSDRLNNSSSSGELAGDLASNERLNASRPSQQETTGDRLNMREHLNSIVADGLLFLSEVEFDDAIVGVADRIGMEAVVVYDVNKIIDILCERDGMDRDEASEYFDFNIAGAYVGPRTPMFISLIGDLMW